VTDLILKANHRNTMKKKTRFLRRQGITPTHVFGHNLESLPLQCDTAELKSLIAKAGKTRPVKLKIDSEKQERSVFIREIQRNEITKQLLHVDFYQVRKGEKIAVDVPIVLVGEAPAMKLKGRMITHGIASLSIECLSESVPPQIEVDLSSLEESEQPICVRDIVLGKDITVHSDPEQLIVKVSETFVESAEGAAEVEAEAGAKTEAPAEE